MSVLQNALNLWHLSLDILSPKAGFAGFGASHLAAVKSTNTPQQITMGRGRKAAGT
jgi:hypothetical protein